MIENKGGAGGVCRWSMAKRTAEQRWQIQASESGVRAASHPVGKRRGGDRCSSMEKKRTTEKNRPEKETY